MGLAVGMRLDRYEICAQLGAGDPAKACKSYQDFLALWKDAVADTPMLIEAKREYEKPGQ